MTRRTFLIVFLGLNLELAAPSLAQGRAASQPALATQVAALLDQAMSEARQMRSEFSRADAFKAIARVYAMTGDARKAARALELAAAALHDWDTDGRSADLIKLADAQLKIGDRDGAIKSLADAFDSAAKVTSDQRVYWLIGVAEAQSRAGLPQADRTFEMALAAADQQNPKHNGIEFEHLIEGLARAGRIEKARAIIAGMTEEFARGRCWDRMAEGQTSTGDIAGAMETIKLIESKFNRDERLADIVVEQLRRGDLAGARRTAAQITGAYDVKFVRAKIAAAQGVAGDFAGAIEAIGRMDDAFYQTEAYAEVCEEAVRRRDMATGRQLVARMEALADKNSFDVPRGWEPRSIAFASLGKCQALVGDDAGSKRSFATARDAADHGDDEDTFQGAPKARNMKALAIAAASAGQLDAAKSDASAIKWFNMQVEADGVIAAAQSRRGDLNGALQWIHSLEDPDARAAALTGAAEGLLQHPSAASQPAR